MTGRAGKPSDEALSFTFTLRNPYLAGGVTWEPAGHVSDRSGPVLRRRRPVGSGTSVCAVRRSAPTRDSGSFCSAADSPDGYCMAARMRVGGVPRPLGSPAHDPGIRGPTSSTRSSQQNFYLQAHHLLTPRRQKGGFLLRHHSIPSANRRLIVRLDATRSMCDGHSASEEGSTHLPKTCHR